MTPSAYLSTIVALAFILASGTTAEAQKKNATRQITVEKAVPDAQAKPDQGKVEKINPDQGAAADQGKAGDGDKGKVEQGAAVDQGKAGAPTGVVDQAAPQDGAQGAPPVKVVKPHPKPVVVVRRRPPRYVEPDYYEDDDYPPPRRYYDRPYYGPPSYYGGRGY